MLEKGWKKGGLSQRLIVCYNNAKAHDISPVVCGKGGILLWPWAFMIAITNPQNHNQDRLVGTKKHAGMCSKFIHTYIPTYLHTMCVTYLRVP